MMTTRMEHDSFGNIEVPAERLWGAQTQRSLAHFHISSERMPEELMLALAAVKRACALVNRDLGLPEMPPGLLMLRKPAQISIAHLRPACGERQEIALSQALLPRDGLRRAHG